MLKKGTFKTAGNQIKIYDYYTPTTGAAGYYIGVDPDEYIESERENQATWPFVTKRYNWTPDGIHKFFGWLAKDANFDNPSTTDKDESMTAKTFFEYKENEVTKTLSFNESEKTLTIPSKSMQQGTPQFDFMYSNIYERNLNSNPDYVTAVPLEFSHLFTAFSIAAQNLSASEITIKSVTINGLKNTNSATIDFSGDATTVEYGEGTNDGNFVFEPNQLLGTSLIDLSSKKIEREYFLMWPMSAAEAKTVSIKVVYTVNKDDEITKTINLTETAWIAGAKNNINLIFKDKEITLQCLVMDWIPQPEEIDFSDQVMVRDTLSWNKSTVRSVNYTTGEVILYDDVDIQAICSFHIETPKGATWTASLIPIEGHQDAFKFVESTKYGAVGKDSQVNLVVTNQAPIAPRHVCILRITVQTADGRTIVVRNLVPDGKSYTEFKIIQNLING